MPRTSKPPKYSRHSSGQARVRINGTVRYLGLFGSPESHEEYGRLLAEWRESLSGTTVRKMTVRALCVLYLRHAQQHYRKDGRETTEVSAIRTPLKHLVRLYGKRLAEELTPRMLKSVRDAMIAAAYYRQSINKHIGRIKRMLKWAVSEEILPVNVYLAAQTVTGLQRGRTEAVEAQRVKVVADALVDAIRPYVGKEVWGMIELQRATGMRPSEVRLMRAIDLNMQGDIWEYVPKSHKTEHHDKQRIVMIGPRGQNVLAGFIRTDVSAFLFSPSKDGKRPYRRDSYRNAIVRGCEKAFEMPFELRRLDVWLARQKDFNDDQIALLRRNLLDTATEWRREHCWCPSRLRHNFATVARRSGGIESARVALGHSSAVTSEIYAEKDFAAARELVSKIG